MTLTRPLLALLLAGTLTACDSDDEGDGATYSATAAVSPPELTPAGQGISGTVALTETDGELTLRLNLTGATPGEHGFHIHSVGTCAPADLPAAEDPDTDPDPAGAALGHYDPLGTMDHGAPDDEEDNKHAADFGNVTAAANGTITATITTDDVSLVGSRAVEGRAVMVHAAVDDLETDPGGMSGARIGCGIIGDVTTASES